MATFRVSPFLSTQFFSWFRGCLFNIAAFMLAFGFASWLVYGAIKDVFSSLPIKALMRKLVGKRKDSSRR